MAAVPYEPPADLNVADYFLDRRIRAGDGERIALRLDDGNWTYAQVQALADDFARALTVRGARREERILLALPDSAEFVGAFFGILKLGAVVVMLNPQLKDDEIAAQIAYTRAHLVIVDAEHEAPFRHAAEASPWIEGGLLVTNQSGDGQSGDGQSGDGQSGDGQSGDGSFAAALAKSNPEPVSCLPTHADDAAIWLFSGGTTGRPKGVVQSHASFANTTELYAVRTLGYGPDDITLSVPKLFFGYATGCNLLFPFAVGASAVLFPEHPTPDVLFDKIARHRPTILINVPTVIGRMVHHPSATEQDLSCLRFATSAGEALPASLHDRWRDLFGTELLDGLGTAEMWHVFLTNRPGNVMPGTLGRVVDGFEVRVCDPEGTALPDGEVGRMWVRGGSRAISYWQNATDSADAFRGDWYVSGDLLKRDADGYFTYCGRSDDAMKVAGRWMVPGEVESCLLEHPAVKECAVVGAVDHEGLTKPCAFVLPQDEPTAELEQQLKDFTLERLQAYKHPRRILVLQEFPRTHLGKIDRGALKRLAES